QIWSALGDLERDAEHYPQAVTDYSKAIDALPKDAMNRWAVYYARGIAYHESGKLSDAERDLKEALRLSPDQPDVLNFLGYSWVDQKRNMSDAVKMLEKAHTLRPLDGYIADSVGWAYYRMGRYDDAAMALEEAVLLAPGTSEINDHLGDAYWHVGRKIEARFQWRHALSLDPEEKDKASIQKKLDLGLDVASSSNG